MYHQSGNKWRRCQATIRPGYGVSNCPQFSNGAHLDTRAIAAFGGGEIERDGSLTKVSGFDPKEGYYTITAKDGREWIYNPHNNERVSWIDRRNTPIIEDLKKEAKFLQPQPEVLDVYDSALDNNERIAYIRKFNDGRYAGVNVQTIPRKTLEMFSELIYFVQKTKYIEDKDYRHLQHAALYHLIVEKKSVKEAVGAGFKDFAADKAAKKDFVDPLLEKEMMAVPEGHKALTAEQLSLYTGDRFEGDPEELDAMIKNVKLEEGAEPVSKNFKLSDREREFMGKWGTGQFVRFAERSMNIWHKLSTDGEARQTFKTVDDYIHDGYEKVIDNLENKQNGRHFMKGDGSALMKRVSTPKQAQQVSNRLIENNNIVSAEERKVIFENAPAVPTLHYNELIKGKMDAERLEKLSKAYATDPEEFVKKIVDKRSGASEMKDILNVVKNYPAGKTDRREAIASVLNGKKIGNATIEKAADIEAIENYLEEFGQETALLNKSGKKPSEEFERFFRTAKR